MSEPIVDEIVAWLEDRISRLDPDFGVTVTHAALAALISDWRKRGEALEEATAKLEFIEEEAETLPAWELRSESERNYWRCRAREALTVPRTISQR